MAIVNKTVGKAEIFEDKNIIIESVVLLKDSKENSNYGLKGDEEDGVNISCVKVGFKNI